MLGWSSRVHGAGVRRHFLPTQRAFDELVPPARADLVLPADNALGPE